MFHLPTLARMMGIEPRTVCEIGVHTPDLCRVAHWHQKCHVLLVEPLPICAQALLQTFPFAEVIEAAIARETGTAQLYFRGQTSWLIEELEHTPALDVDHHKPLAENIHEVRALRMDAIDPGTIDILAIDTEGAEFFALEHLQSRPRIIVIETHAPSPDYQNPYRAEIESWCRQEGYTLAATEAADSLYVRL